MARVNSRRRLSTAPSSRYGSATPAPAHNSDQENRDPDTQRREKGKARAMGPPPSRASLPTPTSEGSNDMARGQKRKRTAALPAATQHSDSEEERFTRFYDPVQDAEHRREIKRQSRALDREFRETKNDLDGDGLTKAVKKANKLYSHVKQTNDATIDSRLLSHIGDQGHKLAQKMKLGDSSTGIDVDEFLSKCITYMRNGGPANAADDADTSSTQRRRARRQDESEDEDDGGDIMGERLDWEFLGRNACFPFNSRPPVPSFLLGPLSVEKKHRTQTQRRARNVKDTAGKEARPEALTKDDLQQSDENGLTAICTRIRAHLNRHCVKAEQALQRAGLRRAEDLTSGPGKDLARECRITETGGPSLFDYVVNPNSFGQTVENIFYISFLIKEGAVGIQNDNDGLPTIIPTQGHTVAEQRKEKISKHQAVFALDYAVWQKLIEAFDIREPLIPHREQEQPTQVGTRGWYS